MRRNSGRLSSTSSVAKADVTKEGAMNKLSESERKAITERIRGLVRMHVESDMSTGNRVRQEDVI